ncbi:hypothetical protein N7523_001661 [Penicillium sp. IBT 18751x]|nr:hypothetical protein N7523_001661 [Penicillium sp. IBT 18751x]
MTWIRADTASDGSARSGLGADDATMSRMAGHELPQTPNEKPVSSAVPFPIAIVGMAMRLPAGVNTAEKFWEMLINKHDGHCKVPETRYNVDAFYSSSNPGTVKTRHGYYLQDNISHIDGSFFSMSKLEAAKLDPQQRLLLEVVYECMENGGQTNWRGRNIGCFVGVFGEDWLEMSSKDVQHMDRYHVVSAGDFALSNRVSYEYDLQGPSITYRTACSSSMVALHEACQALYTGECTSAIIAGSNLILTPTMTKSISENMVLSPSGLCRTFDAAADGYGRGEAINAVYIKPLADALRAGDPIRSIIRSTAVNCDGRTPGITTPGSEAQERLIRHAYHKAGIDDFSQTAFFECHGTGTIAGDTAETSVVAKVFGKDGIYIGAVKPNVGHSEGASGLTSIIKATLALEKRIIPPNAHFSNPNPSIPFQEAKLKVPLEPTPWPEDRCERVSVNSFGIGGTNAHVIMESFSSKPNQRGRMPPFAVVPRVLVISAKNGKSLQKRVEEIQQYAVQHPHQVNDLVYTLATKREHMVHRAFAIIDQNGDVSEFERSRETSASIAFIFTGQGAQWAGMGRELMLASDRFLSSVRGLDRALSRLPNPPSWTLEDELTKPDEESRVHDTELAQPLCTAVQIALVDVLQEWGVSPAAVIGHSSGEIAAAYAAGAYSVDVAITLSYFRGQALKASSGKLGGMAAVGLAAEKAKKYLLDGVSVACENSPQSVTLSGDQKSLAKVLQNILADEPDTFCKQLNVSVAYHSEHMQHPGWVYEGLIEPFISHNSTMTPLYSTVTGSLISDPSTLNAAYWRNNLRSTVLFNGAVQTLMREAPGPRLFIEIGPHSTLSSPLRQILRLQDTDQTSRYIPTLVRSQPQWRALLATTGRLYVNGAPVELSAVSSNTGKVLTNLPSYPWLHEEGFWSETRLVREWRNPREPQHELLGSRSLESTDIEPSWRRILDGSHVSWLWDHIMGKDMIFPCAGYIAMAGEAIRQTTGSEDYTIRNLLMKTPLLLKDSEATELVTHFRPVKLSDTADSMWYDFTITAYQNGAWKRHCVGQAKAGPDRPYVSQEICPYPRLVPSTPWYEALKKRGLNFGPRFRRLENISASPSSCQAAACVQCINDKDAVESERYALHPTIIDQSLQMIGVAMTHGIFRHLTKLCLPVAVEHIYVRSGHGQMFLDTSCDAAGESITGNTIMVADGKVVLSVEKATLFAIDNADDVDQSASLISRLVWKPHIDLVSLAPQLSPDRRQDSITERW